MTPPVLHANPAELVLTFSGHMHASLIFLDWLLARWTQFILDNSDPRILVVHDHLLPVLYLSAVDGVVVESTTEGTDCALAGTPHRLQFLAFNQEGRITSRFGTDFNGVIFPRILQDQL